jgi:tetratricopeptide repeat protein 30
LQELYEFLEAVITSQTSAEDAYRKFDQLAKKHVDSLRKCTKMIQDGRLARDSDAVKSALRLFDNALEEYVPVLMGMAKIYWSIENYSFVEKILQQNAEFCSEHPVWKVNLAHTFFMQEGKFEEALRCYEPIISKGQEDVCALCIIAHSCPLTLFLSCHICPF